MFDMSGLQLQLKFIKIYCISCFVLIIPGNDDEWGFGKF